MGQPIIVRELPSRANPGVVRFETNRALTGMGHERYRVGTEVFGTRPPDELARRLFARGGITDVHVANNVVTVDLEKGYTSEGIDALITDLYTFYRPGDGEAEGAGEAAAAEAGGPAPDPAP